MSRSQPPVKRRRYHSPKRVEAAADTRRAILSAAHQLFVERGYDAMTMQAIADRAGVALDTVYEVVGRKPQLARLLVESAISNSDQPVPADARDYVRRIQGLSRARDKLTLYAAAVVDIHRRLAPLVRALHVAAPRHPELGAMWREISERRARNMRLFAADLRSTGELRHGLGVDRVADVLWALAAPDMYLLFVEERGWLPEDVEAWLADSWSRLLLAEAG